MPSAAGRHRTVANTRRQLSLFISIYCIAVCCMTYQCSMAGGSSTRLGAAAWVCPSSPPPCLRRRRLRRRWKCLHRLRQELPPPQLLPPPRPLPRQPQLLQQLLQGPRQVRSPQWWRWQPGRRHHLAALAHRRRFPASRRAGVPAALTLLSPLWYLTKAAAKACSRSGSGPAGLALWWSAFAFSISAGRSGVSWPSILASCVQARPLQQRASGWRLPNRPCHTQLLLFALPVRPLLSLTRSPRLKV
jgi:hypothetical protein